MKARLLSDGSLRLSSRDEVRVINPKHPQHARLMQLFRRAAASATPSAPQASPWDDGETWQLSAGYGGFPWKDGMPERGRTYDIPLDSLHEDLNRFGVGASPCGHEPYDPAMAERLVVWRDPANGMTYILDGLSRFHRAQDAHVDTVRAIYLTDAANADEAAQARIFLNAHRGLPEQLEEEQRQLEAKAMARAYAGLDLPDGWTIGPADDSLFGLYRAGRPSPVATASVPAALAARIAIPRFPPSARPKRRRVAPPARAIAAVGLSQQSTGDQEVTAWARCMGITEAEFRERYPAVLCE